MQRKRLGGDVNPTQLNVIEMSMPTETSPASLDTVYRAMMVVRHTPAGTEQERSAVAKVFEQIATLRHPADQIIAAKQTAQAARPNSELEQQAAAQWAALVGNVVDKGVRTIYAEAALENTRHDSALELRARALLRSDRPVRLTQRQRPGSVQAKESLDLGGA